MNDIDEEIKKALSKADHKALDEIGKEAGLFEVIGLSFSGRQAWLTYTLYALGFATFIAGVWMSTKFFTSADIKTSLAWLLGIIVCLFGFSWQQMQKLEILREINRLEMRIMLVSVQPEPTAKEPPKG
jgi:hypothetical protein